jgi:excisionase family DNA binding protein
MKERNEAIPHGVECERLLRPMEVAEILGVPQSTLYAWRYRGDGPPAIRVGKHLRYLAAALNEWLNDQGSGRAP